MKESSSNKIIAGHFNMNSIRNKFEFFKDVINRNINNTFFRKQILGYKGVVFHTGLTGTPKVGDFCSISVKIYFQNLSDSDLTVTLNVFVLRFV